ncbi:MAG: phosphoribosylamine--glycine ligase [Alphaproteobacteria bacterium]|nr:phosphoribosylamine--glycine ligase [Alphaproteobacteria bacterium]
MKVLVVGSGGREHALAWGLARSPRVREVLIAPGNGGTAALGRNVDVDATDVDGLVGLAREEKVGLVVVGPEQPLVDGLVDRLTAMGLAAFGPRSDCARLEGSKAFAKAMMDRCKVPTARWGSFTDEASALAWLERADFDVVVKASGLAAGKGVLIPASKEEAAAGVREMFSGAFGAAGAEVVLEERLVGEEASLLAFCDGTRFVVMPPAQDHKRVGEGDTGLNTGGMGAYAPAPVASAERDALADLAIRPILKAFAADGVPFKGVLYAGLMLTADGPRVLEYNTRFGDPECQVLVPLLASDLLDVILGCVHGRLDRTAVRWRDEVAATVVCAAPGYPGTYPKGLPIAGVAEADALPGVTVFHAGTTLDGEVLRSSGGRVLAVTGRGPSLQGALDRAYAGVDLIAFDGMHVRRDIGWRALRS